MEEESLRHRISQLEMEISKSNPNLKQGLGSNHDQTKSQSVIPVLAQEMSSPIESYMISSSTTQLSQNVKSSPNKVLKQQSAPKSNLPTPPKFQQRGYNNFDWLDNTLDEV